MPSLKRSSTYTTPGGAKRRKTSKYAVPRTATVSTAAALTRSHKILNTKQNVTLRYGERVSFSGIAGSSASYVFSANGLYDPNITGTGHQPRGFDQLMSLYDHYLVKTATIEVWAQNNIANPCLLSILVKDTNAAIPTDIDVLEDTYATHRMMTPNDDSQYGYARFTVDIGKFLGGKDVSEMKGNIATNPTEGVFFFVQVTPVDAASSPSGKHIVRITYNADLIEPKQPASS